MVLIFLCMKFIPPLIVVSINVFRIKLIIEPKKLLVHGSLIKPVIELMMSQIYYFILLKLKKIIKI